MISLQRKRGGIPKDQQVRAIHLECDSADQHDLKLALSKFTYGEERGLSQWNSHETSSGNQRNDLT
jgi:hypothetical protein